MSTVSAVNQAAIQPYKVVLSQDPTHWSLYKSLAALFPKPTEQSHILLKGAWHALDRGKYQEAQELSDAAQKCDGSTFSDRLIDLELLKRQKQDIRIPKKLLEIADIFKQKSLPAQELKAYKRLALLEPNPAYYERVIALYAQTGKPQKAILWTKALATLAPPKIEQALVPAKGLPDIAFGKALWEKYIGDVGVEPPLPPDIEKILERPCPFWGGFFNRKKVRETHVLVLIPRTVNGQPLTLKALGELVQKPRQGTATKYIGFYIGQYTDPPVSKAHWALMSRDVIPDSRGKSYQDQQALIAKCSKKAQKPYEVPTILDAATCIFMEYFRTGTYLYNQNPWTFTRCQEKYDGHWQLAVGGFAPGGLRVDINFRVDGDYDGVGALWKFVLGT